MTDKISRADKVRLWIVAALIILGGFVDGSVQL